VPNNILLKHPKNWGLSAEMVNELTNEAIRAKGLSDVEVSLVFVGRKTAKDLNIKYRNKSYIPQVLGFPMDKVKSGDGLIHLGDIVICTQKLKYEIKFQKSSLRKVLGDWLLHGIENLLM
jgi:rRNA maturation RNase YbeY